ncbi:hypothetical protein GALMADRAFT_139439 [Galerina marginata CBS 339.88]|uniref:BZIP domain-containing protein n=1 Tax=Galerina marginata (strain CBS 339.88) TaxID=685588 RepID=A0A067TC19_GALM3|nr:hypothetical protein GALMADRAFT_139439 [Galerina marginata CBS 339.88]
MLVDNPLYQQSYFTSGSSSYPEYSTELNDIFDTELFNSTFAIGSSIHSSTPSGSRGSSPQTLLTPPQDPLPTSFPEVHDDETNNNFYSLFDDDLKAIDSLTMPSSTSDFMGLSGIDGAYGGGVSGYDMGMGGYGMPMDLSSMGVNMPLMDDTMQASIDPQLVDTPSAISDHGDDESDEKESPKSPVAAPVVEQIEPEKPTITIAPVKVGGHGKARKGTVQSGGVVKKTATASKEKENSVATYIAPVKKASTSSTASSVFNKALAPGPFLTGGNSTKADSEVGDDDDDDLPQDWRPSPEVFAKMTSKEKRQLRNKISARNFRVRRKEYITTLEGDIAERDRMLDHFRTQLGSQESENLALRQEIAALKKALLDGRGGLLNLPPPAPLPEQSAAEALAASSSALSYPSSPLLTANTQKDLPSSSSPRMGNRFWGGVGVGGGFTPVHTTLVPDITTAVRRGLQENMNPALNGTPALSSGIGANKGGLSGFDGFADLNPFTMKTLDAYRMHLWGKMAAQQHAHHQNQNQLLQQQQQQQPSGLASNMRPHFFQPSSKPNMPTSSSYSPPGYGSTLSALLSGKHTTSSTLAYPSPPSSPLLNPKGLASSSSASASAQQQQREKEQQQAMFAAMASQTVFRKLGTAFWDAFTGSSSSSSASASGSALAQSGGNWDADKVQRVLSGKAVLRVVDVEPVTPPVTPKLRAVVATTTSTKTNTSASVAPSVTSRTPALVPSCADDARKCCSTAITDILEESMRSLTLGKKM